MTPDELKAAYREAKQHTKAMRLEAEKPGAAWIAKHRHERAIEHEKELLEALKGGPPQPNECGVYPEYRAEKIEFSSLKGRATCEIHVLQIERGWISALASHFHCGSYGGSSSPLTASTVADVFPDRQAALVDKLERAFTYFDKFSREGKSMYGSCTNSAQLQAAGEMAQILAEYRGGLNQAALFPETGNGA